jgi:hypothetical protein
MTARERIMIYVLGGLALGGIGYAAYTMVLKPIRAESAKIADLEEQIADKEGQRFALTLANRRLAEIKPLTLPADKALAESEYEIMLSHLLRDSKISGGKYVKQTQSDTDPEPELVAGLPGKPGKKAYTKINYSISFDKVNLDKVIDFLERYHRIPLMHQIVKFSIKHSATGNALKQTAEERNDLSVNLVSEAVLLDGAPERRTLFAIPDTFGAALGGVGLHGLRNDTEKARNLTPVPDPAFFALADMKRDYDLLAARDPFHGPLPPYPTPEKPKKDSPKIQGDPPPYDSTPFVYLSSVVRTQEGNKHGAQADIFDRYYGIPYLIEFSQFNELFELKVQRFERDVKTDPKTGEVTVSVKVDRGHPRGDTMEVSDRVGKVIRTFKVYGLNDNALVLGEKDKVGPGKDAPAKGVRPQNGGKAPPVVLPKPDAKMAAVGGLIALKPPRETYYLWEVGQSLKQMRKLSDKEAQAVLAIAAGGLDGEPSPPPPPPISEREVAPPPHVPLT